VLHGVACCPQVARQWIGLPTTTTLPLNQLDLHSLAVAGTKRRLTARRISQKEHSSVCRLETTIRYLSIFYDLEVGPEPGPSGRYLGNRDGTAVPVPSPGPDGTSVHRKYTYTTYFRYVQQHSNRAGTYPPYRLIILAIFCT
jgi:hypothetical protein